MRLLAPVLLLCACEPKLPDGWPHDGGTVGDAGADAGPMRYVAFTGTGDGGYALVLDSQYSNRWTAIDLDRALEVPFEEDRWDLAFQRFHIRARGGASGDGGVAVSFVDAGYAAVTQAPPGPWLEDLPDGDDENMDLDTVFDKAAVWYEYDEMFHSLTPRPLVYLIRSDQGAYFKLKLDGYYDSHGTPAIFTLRYAPVAPP